MYGFPFGDESSAIDNLYEEFIIVLDERSNDVDSGEHFTLTDTDEFGGDDCMACGDKWTELYFSASGKRYCPDCTGHVPDYE